MSNKYYSLKLLLSNNNKFIMNVVPLPGCEYGDHATWCQTMATSGCYVNKKTCCKKCKELRSNDASKFDSHDATKILCMFFPISMFYSAQVTVI